MHPPHKAMACSSAQSEQLPGWAALPCRTSRVVSHSDLVHQRPKCITVMAIWGREGDKGVEQLGSRRPAVRQCTDDRISQPVLQGTAALPPALVADLVEVGAGIQGVPDVHPAHPICKRAHGTPGCQRHARACQPSSAHDLCRQGCRFGAGGASHPGGAAWACGRPWLTCGDGAQLQHQEGRHAHLQA